MGLVNTAEMLSRAREGKYAVGHFNINNLEFTQAIVEAAAMERSPVILGVSEGALVYLGLEYTVALGEAAARQGGCVALHLDHGSSFELVVRCIRAGFSSVMIDGSHLPLGENIALTRKVVEVAHAAGVSVEGELGAIGGTEDDRTGTGETLADPDEALRFVKETGVDSLAAAVGTAHGLYREEVRIRFDLIEALAAQVPVPLVLHGASGVPDEMVRRAIDCGVAKVNVNTENQVAFTGAVRRILEERPDLYDPRRYLGPAREAVRETVRQKLRLFGSGGRVL